MKLTHELSFAMLLTLAGIAHDRLSMEMATGQFPWADHMPLVAAGVILLAAYVWNLGWFLIRR